MKYKLKNLNFNKDSNISFIETNLDNGTIINLKYNNDTLEFQTPKVIIESLIKENNNEYFILKIVGNQACKTFCSKILEFEDFLQIKYGLKLKTIFNEDVFTVIIPFKYSKPLVKVYKDDSLFNYYQLSKDMEIICLINIDKLWINNCIHYNLNVKEIMVL